MESADRAEARGNVNTALNALNAFVNEVDAQVGAHLTQEEADELLACTQARIDALMG